MVPAVVNNKINTDTLQEQKKQHIKITADEKEDITHGRMVLVGSSVLAVSSLQLAESYRSQRANCRLPTANCTLTHHKRIPVVMFQSNPCATYHAFQRIICHVYG